VAVLLASGKADESIPAPKGRESRTPRTFPCKLAASWEPRRGAKMPIADPSGQHPPPPRLRLAPPWRWARPMPPLGQYFPRLQKPDESQTSPSLPPKGTDPGTLRHFPCKLAASWGPRRGAMMPIADPSGRHPSAASVGGGAEAMPPLWQYFLRLLSRMSRWLHPKEAVNCVARTG
jgi:hypothetical protein